MRRLLPILLAAVLSAAPAVAPAPAVLADADVPPLLRGGELTEWSRARRLHDDGRNRAAQGRSIAETPRVPIKGGGGESPEAAKQRGLAIQKEGEEAMARANLTLDRLRATAAARLADQTKTVSAASELASQSWSEGSLVAAVRGIKAARDTGADRHHVLGVWTFDAAGVPSRGAELTADLREAWRKAQAERDYLQPEPNGGYRIAAGPDAAHPVRLSDEDEGADAPGKVALAWGEVHVLADDLSVVLIRVADAHSLRLLASEAFLCSPRGDKVPRRAALTLRDDRSFLPRLAASASWRLGYAPDANPLGASLLRHVCHRLGQVPVWADDALTALGIAALPSASNAVWSIKPVAPAPAGERLYKLDSTPASPPGARPVAVGQLSFRVESTEAPADKPR